MCSRDDGGNLAAFAQEPVASQPVSAPVESERWNLLYQATSIGQYHGTFRSPCAGPFSLQNYAERDVSVTTTVFPGLRLNRNTTLYFVSFDLQHVSNPAYNQDRGPVWIPGIGWHLKVAQNTFR